MYSLLYLSEPPDADKTPNNISDDGNKKVNSKLSIEAKTVVTNLLSTVSRLDHKNETLNYTGKRCF